MLPRRRSTSLGRSERVIGTIGRTEAARRGRGSADGYRWTRAGAQVKPEERRGAARREHDPPGSEAGTRDAGRGARRARSVRTLRHDRWWASPAATVVFLTAFVVYATWAVFQNAHYYVGAAAHRDLISPFYSPCLTAAACRAPAAASPDHVVDDLPGDPGRSAGPLAGSGHLLLLPQGLLPELLAVATGLRRWPTATPSYTGETRFPLILQNVHRYFFFIALIFNIILTIDAVMAFRLPGDGGIGVSIGTLVLVTQRLLLWLYSLVVPRLSPHVRRQRQPILEAPDPLPALEAPHAAQRPAHADSPGPA